MNGEVPFGMWQQFLLLLQLALGIGLALYMVHMSRVAMKNHADAQALQRRGSNASFASLEEGEDGEELDGDELETDTGIDVFSDTGSETGMYDGEEDDDDEDEEVGTDVEMGVGVGVDVDVDLEMGLLEGCKASHARTHVHTHTHTICVMDDDEELTSSDSSLSSSPTSTSPLLQPPTTTSTTTTTTTISSSSNSTSSPSLNTTTLRSKIKGNGSAGGVSTMYAEEKVCTLDIPLSAAAVVGSKAGRGFMKDRSDSAPWMTVHNNHSSSRSGSKVRRSHSSRLNRQQFHIPAYRGGERRPSHQQ